ncbi:MAG: M13 family metallopeptidase [Acidobacteriaceae bacterium]
MKSLKVNIGLCLLALTLSAAAQDNKTKVQIPAKPTVPSEAKKVPGFSVDNMDKSVRPCDDFYQYACGQWRANNPIPPDQASWGRFNELRDANTAVLHTIVEELAAKPTRTQLEQQVGDYYAACMDESAIDKRGAEPIKAELVKIDAIQSKEQLIAYVATLHQRGINALFGFGASPNLHDAKMYIANITQGGTTLDKEDYEKPGAERDKMRSAYVEHVAKMFQLLGDDAGKANAEARTVLQLETALSNMQLSRIEMRNPRNRDNPTKFTALQSSVPNLYLAEYAQGVGAAPFTEMNVVNPDFFKGLNEQIEKVPLADWKVYLKWHLLHEAAPMLAKPFREENFDFFNKTLSGQQQEQPRWKRCTNATDRALGEALGQFYVERAFGKDAKQRMLVLVNDVEGALHQDIETLDWMSPATKQEAIVKLNAITNKIGYPDKWKDYSKVVIKRDDPVENMYAASEFERNRNIRKIGNPVDKSDWSMSPPTVNAYYSSSTNDINFPAGILQPPFFDPAIDDAVNYGGIGVVIGHELTHGFDDQGRKFDANGNFRDWWTKEDGIEFEKRAACVADEYEAFSPVPGTHLQGRLTLGENTADNGGSHIAMMALMAHLKKTDPAAIKKLIDGFTPQQRFFLGFAQVWCENTRPESAKRRAQSDPHSPGEFRVNGTLMNNTDFDQAFGCKKGDKMVAEKQCRVW